MVSIDVVKTVNVWSDELKDKHNVISSVQVCLFVSLNSLRNLLFLFIFLNELVHIDFLSGLDDNLLLALFFLHFLSLRINIVVVYLYAFVVKLLIFFEVYS